MPSDLNADAFDDHVRLFVPDQSRAESKLQVITCGLARSGTTSLSHALHILGFGPIHHFQSLIFDSNLPKTWKKAIEARQGRPTVTKEEWDTVFHGFNSAVDAPACYLADELARVYPEAKVIVNQRDFESWYQSYCATIRNFSKMPRAHWLWRTLVPSIKARAEMLQAQRRIVGFAPTFAAADPKEEALKVYEAHYAQMRQNIPADRRLDWYLGDGWEPLCAFLGVPIPDQPFPHVNTKDDFAGMVDRVNTRIRKMALENILYAVRSGIVIVAIAGVAVLTTRPRQIFRFFG